MGGAAEGRGGEIWSGYSSCGIPFPPFALRAHYSLRSLLRGRWQSQRSKRFAFCPQQAGEGKINMNKIKADKFVCPLRGE